MISRNQWLLIISAVMLTVLLMFFPKGVIQKKNTNTANRDQIQQKEEKQEASSSTHQVQIPKELKTSIDSIKNVYHKTNDIKFLEKIGDLYFEATAFDSASYYYENVSKQKNSLAVKIKLSEAYYSWFSITEGRDAQVAQKCVQILEEIVTISPDNLEAKSKLGYVTTLTSEAPMKGVKILKEVLAKNPNFRTALFDLGLLDIRSGQIEKAQEKFEKLLKIDYNDQLSRFYLAVCYKEKKDLTKTKELVEIIAKSDANPVVVSEAKKLLVAE